MGTQVQVICDGCNEPIDQGNEPSVKINAIDPERGLIQLDYHNEHIPDREEMLEKIEAELPPRPEPETT